jgi:hypothetical protein
LAIVGHESAEEQPDEDDIAAKLENCFITFLLLHLGHSTGSLPSTNVSKISPHLSHINSNIGII